MIHQNSKTSPMRRAVPKSESTTGGNGKLQPKSGSSSSRAKLEEWSKGTASPSSSHQGVYDSQIKLKLTESSPRNRAKETSKGVQKFIRQLSDIIDNRNPFKETCSWESQNCKNVPEAPRNDSIQFNTNVKRTQKAEQQDQEIVSQSEAAFQIDFNEANRRLARKLKYREKINSFPIIKKDTSTSGGSETKSRSYSKIKEHVEKKQETSPPKTTRKSTNAGKEVRTAKSTPKPRSSGAEGAHNHSRNQNKRKRPSEIPLRKNRKDLCKKPPLSGKPQNEMDEKVLADLCPNSSEDLPRLEKFDAFSELQMIINVNFSSERVNELGEETKLSEQSLVNETDDSSKLDDYYRSQTLLDISRGFLETRYSSGNKTNVLDLRKAKTSSFTVLRTNSVVLDKLEKLHKKNILKKEKATKFKGSSVTVSPKISSPNLLKKKCSKKKLFFRSSSKGNKPTLKTKVKTKTEPRQELPQSKPIASRMESESKQQESPKSVKNSGKIVKEDNLKAGTEEKVEMERVLGASERVPTAPPPSPENQSLILNKKEKEEKTNDDKSNEECNTAEQKVVEENTEPTLVDKANSSKVKQFEVTPLKFGEEEGVEKPKLKSPIMKKRLKIDLNTHVPTSKSMENNPENEPVEIEMSEGQTFVKISSNDPENQENEEEASPDLLTKTNENEPLNLEFEKPHKSLPHLKRKSQSKSRGDVESTRKKRIRSDAGDRPSPSGSGIFKSNISIQNKNKPDTKLRSGLTKPSKREDKSDVFEEDSTEVKLRRRNSEPNSLRGYVWRYDDPTTPKGHKASVSSLTSSMRHLNTDDIDDFIFWESIPQKVTSCWEMSLYNFKRPWTVLSPSVFKDNRKSHTPGLILENLRNGGKPTSSQFSARKKERTTCHNENPFDVEPSIAQKNIDIRNWLAALNFPTLPSTSNDAFSEGNFSSPVPVDGQHLNKPQVIPKRRKAVSNLKFSEERKKFDEMDKFGKSGKWSNDEGLNQLVQTKSGGFVTCDEMRKSEHLPNVTVSFCAYSKSVEDSILVETSDKNSSCELRKYKSVEITIQPEVSVSAIINSGKVFGGQVVENVKKMEKQEVGDHEGQNNSRKIPGFFRSDFNIWKYLFLMTVFIIFVRYFSLNNAIMCNK